jgi:hypothetical protein
MFNSLLPPPVIQIGYKISSPFYPEIVSVMSKICYIILKCLTCFNPGKYGNFIYGLSLIEQILDPSISSFCMNTYVASSILLPTELLKKP